MLAAYLATGLLILAAPSFAAGMLVGGWYIYSPLLAEGQAFLTLGLALALCVVVAASRKEVAKGLPVDYRTLGAYMLFIIALALRQSLGDDSVYSTTKNVLGFMLLGLAVSCFASSSGGARRFSWGFILSSVIYAIAEIVRVVQGGRIHIMAVAFGANPIFAGHLLAFALTLGALLWVGHGMRGRVALPVLITLAVGIVTLASMGPIVGLVIGFAYLLLFRTPPKTQRDIAIRYGYLILIATVSIVVQRFVSNSRGQEASESSMTGRGTLWEGAFEMIKGNPVFGHGTDILYPSARLGDFSVVMYPHNIFLEVWMVYGLIPVILMALAFLAVFKANNHGGRVVVLLIIFSFSVSGTLNESFNLWMGLAISFVASALVRDKFMADGVLSDRDVDGGYASPESRRIRKR